jgi:hypothetical protein
MSRHPLTTFIYETFGKQFGELLLAGFGAEPDEGQRRLHLTESQEGLEADWAIEFVATRLPCGDDPLVLAALLKLLLSCPITSQCLEFEFGELLAELRWPNDPDTRRQVEEALVSYAGLLYDQREGGREGRRAQAASEGGCYHLLTGYVRGAESGTGGSSAKSHGVYFDDGFIRGLKEGRIYFAGIDFGTLNRTGK